MSASLWGALAYVASFRALPPNSQGDRRLLSLLLRGPSLIGSGPCLLQEGFILTSQVCSCPVSR